MFPTSTGSSFITHTQIGVVISFKGLDVFFFISDIVSLNMQNIMPKSRHLSGLAQKESPLRLGTVSSFLSGTQTSTSMPQAPNKNKCSIQRKKGSKSGKKVNPLTSPPKEQHSFSSVFFPFTKQKQLQWLFLYLFLQMFQKYPSKTQLSSPSLLLHCSSPAGNGSRATSSWFRPAAAV